MGVANALHEMHAVHPLTPRQLRRRSKERLEAVDRMLGRVEAAMLGRDQALDPGIWEALGALSAEFEVPLPRELQPRMSLDRLHATLLDWQEDVMNHEFPDRRAFIAGEE